MRVEYSKQFGVFFPLALKPTQRTSTVLRLQKPIDILRKPGKALTTQWE